MGPTGSQDAERLVGRRLGEFVVREPLSSGGFGMVFRAEQPALAREAVIKVLHTKLLGSETVVQRFLREARMASRLDHPYAAHTYAFGVEPDGVFWIAMELVRGTPLDALLVAHGPIPIERFVPLLERICEVVHTAHERGIVHRDLKPANVMVLSRAGRLLPKLLDFGIAKLDGTGEPAEAEQTTESSTDRDMMVEPPELATTVAPDPCQAVTAPLIESRTPPSFDDSGRRLTQVGATMGSPLYMAPEQWSDATAVDARTDIYALGVLCYEALTGRPPFSGANHFALLMAHAKTPPPPLGAGFPRELDGVLARALAKDPANRFATALELASAFRVASGLASEPVALARLDDSQRDAIMTRAPRPIALAVDALVGARNPHQQRDALWQVVRTAIRLLGVAALASHSHVRTLREQTDPAIAHALRRLRGRALSDSGWLELGRELVRPFAAIRDAHPVPELVDFLGGSGSAVLDELLELRSAADESGGGGDERVRELIERALPCLGTLLERLEFLRDYPLVVVTDGRAEEWVGVRRAAAAARPLSSPVAEGRPVLVDADGTPVVSLWPFVQLRDTVPSAERALFFFEGRGRRGARLIALPDAFEHDDEELWDALGTMLDDRADSSGRDAEERCPFPGLSAFTAADAANFFGRERESELFVNRLRVSPLLAVVGPSGAGKSSFVQAGVVSRLPQGWRAEIIRPGPAPLATLAARLAAIGVRVVASRDDTGDAPGAVATALRAYAAAEQTTVVLVVDQLEEVFTLCDDRAEREAYAEVLSRCARSADDPVRVVFTLRDDFLLAAEALPALRSRLGQTLHLLTTPDAPELRRILCEPIRRAGYEFDDAGLPQEMVDSVEGAPGALALLSFTASRLWDLRDRRFRHLGHRAYRTLGGVGGALAQHAEDLLRGMTAEEKRLVREVFRHAVTSQGTRAVLRRAELDDVLGGGPHASAVVEKLVGGRLLVVSEGEAATERVEIAHEALLDAWPRLVDWRREDAEGARLRDQLRTAARQWEERGRPSGLLWRGDALLEYRLWRARYPGTLTSTEVAFGDASAAEAARGRLLRRVGAAVSIAILVAGSVALLWANRRTEAQRRQAVISAGEARARLVELRFEQARQAHRTGNSLEALTYAEDALRSTEPDLAMRYLVAAALRNLAAETMTLRPHVDDVPVARFLTDGTRVVTGGQAGPPKIWDAASGHLVRSLVELADATMVAPSDDGKLLAAGSSEGVIGLWRTDTGDRIAVVSGHEARVSCLAFAPDGQSVVTGSWDRTVRVWRLPLDRAQVSFEVADGPVRECDLDPGGRWILTASNRARLWDARTGTLLHELDETRLDTQAMLSPDGAIVAVVAGGHPIPSLWDAATGKLVARLRGHSVGVTTAAFSRDGRWLATAGRDQVVNLWRVEDGTLHASLPHPAEPEAIAFDPTGTLVASASSDRRVRVWRLDDGRLLASTEGHLDRVNWLEFSPDGATILTASRDDTARLWSARPAGLIRSLPPPAGDRYSAAALSPDGRHVLSYSEAGIATLWDLSRPEPVATLTQFRTRPDRTVLVSSLAARAVPALDPEARLAAIPLAETVVVVELPTGRELFRIGHDQRVTCARFSPDGRLLATASLDQHVRVWDVAGGGKLLHELTGHTSRVWVVGFSPDGTRLASGDLEGAMFVWDVSRGDKIYSVKAHARALFGLSFSPDGRRIASAGMNRPIKIWDATGPVVLSTLETQSAANAIAFAPDGQRLLSIDGGGYATVWDLKRAQELDRLGVGGTQGTWIEVSADSRRLLVVSDSIEVWDIAPRWEHRNVLADRLSRTVPFALDKERLVRKREP